MQNDNETIFNPPTVDPPSRNSVLKFMATEDFGCFEKSLTYEIEIQTSNA